MMWIISMSSPCMGSRGRSNVPVSVLRVSANPQVVSESLISAPATARTCSFCLSVLFLPVPLHWQMH